MNICAYLPDSTQFQDQVDALAHSLGSLTQVAVEVLHLDEPNGTAREVVLRIHAPHEAKQPGFFKGLEQFFLEHRELTPSFTQTEHKEKARA